MDQLWLEVVKQAPSLGVLTLLVYWFLQAQDKRDKQLTELGQSCHAFQEQTTHTVSDVLDRNSIALTANTHMLGRVESALDGRSHRAKPEAA